MCVSICAENWRTFVSSSLSLDQRSFFSEINASREKKREGRDDYSLCLHSPSLEERAREKFIAAIWAKPWKGEGGRFILSPSFLPPTPSSGSSSCWEISSPLLSSLSCIKRPFSAFDQLARFQWPFRFAFPSPQPNGAHCDRWRRNEDNLLSTPHFKNPIRDPIDLYWKSAADFLSRGREGGRGKAICRRKFMPLHPL